jgi:hypothetical protein
MNARIKYQRIAQKRQPQVNRMYAVYFALIKQVFDGVASNLEQGKKEIPEATAIADMMKPKVKASYKGVITGGFRAGIEDCEEAYGKPLPVLVKKSVSDEDLMNLGMGNTIKKIEGQAMKQVVTISETLHDVLRTQFKHGTENNETLPQLTSRIRRCADDYPTWMARRIAKTESTRAWNASTLEAYSQSSVAREKEWVPYPLGSGHRSFHSGIANVPVDKPFQVMGEDLMYPGDPAGSPENIINCVCAMSPVIGRRTGARPVVQVPVQEPTAEIVWVDSNTISELQEQFSRFGINNVSLMTGDPQISLELGNKIGKDWLRVVNEMKGQNGLLNISNIPRLNGVKFVSPSMMNSLTGQATGVYWKGDKFILLRSKQFSDQALVLGKFNATTGIEGTFRHEYGHHIYENIGDKKLDLEWREIYKHGIGGPNYFMDDVSKYASSNFDEAFSECFSVYTSPLYKKGMMNSEIENYFEKLLGKKVVTTPVNVATTGIGGTAVSAPIESPKTFVGASNYMKNNFSFSYVDAVGYKNEKDAFDKLNSISNSYTRILESNPRLKQLFDEKKISSCSFSLVNKSSVLSDAKVLGAYNVGTRQLLVSGKLKIGSSPLTLGKWNVCYGVDDIARHELGHHLVFQLKTKDVTSGGWGSLYNSHDKSWWAKNVSKYGSSNSGEAFAESFAAYTHPQYGIVGKRLPADIEDWFDKVLKGKAELNKHVNKFLNRLFGGNHDN